MRRVLAFWLGIGALVALGVSPALANHIGSSDITNQDVRKIDIAPNAVGTSEIVDNSIQKVDIDAEAVGSSEILNQTIKSVDIATGAVGSAEILNGAVLSADIAAGAVGASEIATDAVGSDEIAAGAVGASEIATGGVEAAEIATGAVGSDEIAADAVGTSEIATGGVESAEIATDAVGSDEIAGGAVGTSELAADIQVETADTYASAGSFQLLAADLTLDPAAGSADGGDPDFLGAAMGNILGADLTNDANYVGGLIGHYSVTGGNASTYPTGAVLAGVGDGTTTADGAVVAYVDGDSAVTTSGAAFKVMSNNSTAASGFNFGLDLQDSAHDGYQAVDEDFYLKAPLRMVRDVVVLVDDAAPTDGVTGDDIAGPGSLYVDTSGAELYINTGTISSPAWTVVGTQT